jgi:hypothetical protein
MMADSALAPDSRFGEMDGGTDIYPDARGVWRICEEGEMSVSGVVCRGVIMFGWVGVYMYMYASVLHAAPTRYQSNRTYTYIHIHQVEAGPMVHTVPCVGFVVTEKDRPGMCVAVYGCGCDAAI